MRRQLHHAVGWVAVLGSLALLHTVVSGRRPPPPELRAATEFIVTTLADDGTGSLREAIFAAAATPGRTRIRLPAGRLALRSALPPIVNAHGVVIEGVADATEIDGAAVAGPVLDFDAPDSRLTGVRIVNAPAQAVLARQDGLHVTASSFADCDYALHAGNGVDGLVVERSTFTGNRIAIRIEPSRGRVEIRGNRFAGHTDAAIWAVRERRVEEPVTGDVIITDNTFDGDRLSIVAANTGVLAENNEFTNALDAALQLMGSGAVVRGNRIRDGTGVGVIADDADGTVIDGNEIDHNQGIGVLVRSSGEAVVRGNRLYQNGYGLAFVFGRPNAPNVGAQNTLLQHTHDGVVVIGDSPVLRDNRVLNGRLAGLRILDYYSSDGVLRSSVPLLQRNHVEGNLTDDTVRGEYHAPARERASR